MKSNLKRWAFMALFSIAAPLFYSCSDQELEDIKEPKEVAFATVISYQFDVLDGVASFEPWNYLSNVYQHDHSNEEYTLKSIRFAAANWDRPAGPTGYIFSGTISFGPKDYYFNWPSPSPASADVQIEDLDLSSNEEFELKTEEEDLAKIQNLLSRDKACNIYVTGALPETTSRLVVTVSFEVSVKALVYN